MKLLELWRQKLLTRRSCGPTLHRRQWPALASPEERAAMASMVEISANESCFREISSAIPEGFEADRWKIDWPNIVLRYWATVSSLHNPENLGCRGQVSVQEITISKGSARVADGFNEGW